jgi:hypothetical protein
MLRSIFAHVAQHAIGIVAPPVYIALAQRPLRQVLGLCLDDADARAELVDDVVAFVCRALRAPQGGNA